MLHTTPYILKIKLPSIAITLAFLLISFSNVNLKSVSARTFTVTNNCPFTIWPAIFTDLNVGSATPNMATGWEAAPSSSVHFDVPDNWKSGRIWGRRGCDFSTNPGPNSCLDGGCNGGLLCDPHTGTGVPPASVAEWTLSGDGNQDFYDTSLVDGYNLPLRITNNVGCPVADCPVDLGPNCPSPLRGPLDPTGFVVGCRSACQANLDGNPANSVNCCSGSHDTPATCPPSGVEFYSYFKTSCPNSYVYAFDESSGTALWTCDSARNADYTLAFCPSGNVTNPLSSGVTGTALPSGVSVGTASSSSVPTPGTPGTPRASSTSLSASAASGSATAPANTNSGGRSSYLSAQGQSYSFGFDFGYELGFRFNSRVLMSLSATLPVAFFGGGMYQIGGE